MSLLLSVTAARVRIITEILEVLCRYEAQAGVLSLFSLLFVLLAAEMLFVDPVWILTSETSTPYTYYTVVDTHLSLDVLELAQVVLKGALLDAHAGHHVQVALDPLADHVGLLCKVAPQTLVVLLPDHLCLQCVVTRGHQLADL